MKHGEYILTKTVGFNFLQIQLVILILIIMKSINWI